MFHHHLNWLFSEAKTNIIPGGTKWWQFNYYVYLFLRARHIPWNRYIGQHVSVCRKDANQHNKCQDINVIKKHRKTNGGGIRQQEKTKAIVSNEYENPTSQWVCQCVTKDFVKHLSLFLCRSILSVNNGGMFPLTVWRCSRITTHKKRKQRNHLVHVLCGILDAG